MASQLSAAAPRHSTPHHVGRQHRRTPAGVAAATPRRSSSSHTEAQQQRRPQSDRTRRLACAAQPPPCGHSLHVQPVSCHPAPFSGAHLAQQPRSLHLHVEEALLHSFFATLFTWRPCHTLHVEEALSRGPFRLKYCFTLQGKVLLHFPGCSTQSASAGGDGILHPRG